MISHNSSYLQKACFLLFIPVLLGIQTAFSQAHQGKSLSYYLHNAPFEMPDLSAPQFPDTTFAITDYGAVGDGQVLNTQAIQHTIETCAESGGGTVVVPPGLWLTGPIELKSHVNLHVERGAVLLFTKDHTKYPIIHMPHTDDEYKVESPIYGHDLTDVAITGGGILDGSGQSWRPVKKEKVTADHWDDLLDSGGALNADSSIWWPSKQALNGEEYIDSMESHTESVTAADYLPARDYMRPYMVLLMYCNNVLIDGPTFKNAPKFALYPKFCTNMIIRNVQVNNEYWAQNGDGIDISGGRNVAIYRCTVTAGDDGICMKSSPTDVKGFADPALKNVVIAECTVYHGHGGFVVGSNTDGGINNVAVTNCAFIGTDRGLRFKSRRGRGGLVHNIYIKNISMSNIVDEAIYFNTYYELSGNKKTGKIPEVTATTPRFQDIHISHIYCRGARAAVSITGLPEMPVKNITLTDVRISARHGFSATRAAGITLNHVTILPRSGVVYTLRNSRNIRLNDIGIPGHFKTFLKLAGNRTSGIVLANTDLPHPKQVIQTGSKVSKNALTMK